MCVIKLFDTFATTICSAPEVRDVLYALDRSSMYSDDHKLTPTPVKPKYVLIVTDGQTTKVCPVGPQINGVWAFSLNPLYLKQGEVHLSTMALSTFHIRKDCHIAEAVDLFNQESEANPFCNWRVTFVVVL